MDNYVIILQWYKFLIPYKINHAVVCYKLLYSYVTLLLQGNEFIIYQLKLKLSVSLYFPFNDKVLVHSKIVTDEI